MKSKKKIAAGALALVVVVIGILVLKSTFDGKETYTDSEAASREEETEIVQENDGDAVDETGNAMNEQDAAQGNSSSMSASQSDSETDNVNEISDDLSIPPDPSAAQSDVVGDFELEIDLYSETEEVTSADHSTNSTANTDNADLDSGTEEENPDTDTSLELPLDY